MFWDKVGKGRGADGTLLAWLVPGLQSACRIRRRGHTRAPCATFTVAHGARPAWHVRRAALSPRKIELSHPLAQTAFIIFGAIAAGIFYHEFMALPEGPAGYGGVGLYSLGILMTVLGLAFLAPVPSSSVTSKVDGGVDTRMQKEQAL